MGSSMTPRPMNLGVWGMGEWENGDVNTRVYRESVNGCMEVWDCGIGSRVYRTVGVCFLQNNDSIFLIREPT